MLSASSLISNESEMVDSDCFDALSELIYIFYANVTCLLLLLFLLLLSKCNWKSVLAKTKLWIYYL